MALIFWLSSIPDLRSGLETTYDLILRKFAHALEYAVLGMFVFRAFRLQGLSKSRSLIWSMVVSSLYAVSDEFHQSLVAGRHGSAVDAALDSLGAFLGSAWMARR